MGRFRRIIYIPAAVVRSKNIISFNINSELRNISAFRWYLINKYGIKDLGMYTTAKNDKPLLTKMILIIVSVVVVKNLFLFL